MNKEKIAIRNIFKATVDIEDYRKLTYFEWVKELKVEMPGTRHMYIMYDGGIACCTNALCINEWLVAHNQRTRRPMSNAQVEYKISVNEGSNIDNRSSEWTAKLPSLDDKRIGPKNPAGGWNKRSHPNSVNELRETIWYMFADQHKSPGEIAEELGYTPPNIYYHIKKMQKMLDKV